MREIGYLFTAVIIVATFIIVGATAHLEGGIDLNTIGDYLRLFLPIVILIPSSYFLVKIGSKIKSNHHGNLEWVFLLLFSLGIFCTALYYYLYLANTEYSFDGFLPLSVTVLSVHLGAILGVLPRTAR